MALSLFSDVAAHQVFNEVYKKAKVRWMKPLDLKFLFLNSSNFKFHFQRFFAVLLSNCIFLAIIINSFDCH